MKKRLLFFAAAVLAGSMWATEETAIVVDAGTPLGPVKRNIFGHNLEAAGGRESCIKYGQGFWNAEARHSNPIVVDTVKKLGIGMMRYPGGCHAHMFDWRQFVGPLNQRGNRQFGIDEFITLCRDLGAEPMFTISDYVLPAAEMPAHAAALVEYLNSPATPDHPWAMKRQEWGHPEPYGVKWFELGNETEHGNHGNKWGFVVRRYKPEEYVAYAQATAAAMRKIDPSIKIGVVTKPGTGDDYDCEWNKAVYRDVVPIADFLVVHFYGPGVDGTDPAGNFKSCMAYPEQLQNYMAKYRELCRKLGGKDLPLSVTEYNIGHSTDKPLPYRFSYMAGLLCADMLRLFHQPANGVIDAEYWQVANGWWGMINTHGNAIVKRRATLPFFQLWGEHFGGTLLKTEVIASPCGEAPAAKGMLKACGTEKLLPKKVADIPLPQFKIYNADTEKLAKGLISFRLDGITKETYPAFATFSRPKGAAAGKNWSYRLSCQARFVTDDPAFRDKVILGVGINDMRGYDKTKSASAVTHIEKAKDWQTFSCLLQSLTDCPGITLMLKIEDGNNPFTGKIYHPVKGSLEVRNLKVELFTSPSYPAYQQLTSIASLSKDGQKLHLLVFNKSYDQQIESNVDLKGFTASAANSWTVWQKDVNSLDYADPIRATVKLPPENGKLKMTFPPHSMTAIDFQK